MSDPTFDTRRDEPGSRAHFGTRATRIMRRVAAAAIGVVVFVALLAAAGVLALAALVIAIIIAVGFTLMWVLARIAAPRRGPPEARTLEARKGPRGWTVETRRYSF